MVNWFKTYPQNLPNTNVRLVPYIIDFNCEQDITEEIFENPLSQAVAAVKDIIENYQPPYNVFVSGGIDSQAMLWAWYKSGYEFTAYHFDYGNNLNDHDKRYLFKFIEKNSLEKRLNLKIVNFDVVKFITSSQLREYAIKFDTASPQILTHIKFTEQVKGTSIFSGNFIDFSKNVSLTYSSLGLYRFYQQFPNKIVPYFFLQTPQLAYAFYPRSLTDLQAGPGYYLSKVNMLRNCGFPVFGQPTKKTGFEKMKLIFDDVNVPSQLRIKWGNQSSNRPFDLLYRYSNFDHIGYYTDSVEVVHHRSINIFRKNHMENHAIHNRFY